MSENNLTYSSDALNILPEFHETDFILFVEGEDDIMFWDVVFKKTHASTTITIKIADGGCTQIDEYITKIISGELNILVARDSDYLDFLNTKRNHPNILYTYGYSIENTLITKHSISSIINTLCRGFQESSEDIDKIIHDFEQSVFELLALDLTNEAHGHGVSILGNHHGLFTQKSSTHVICPNLAMQFRDNKCSDFESTHVESSMQQIHSNDNRIIELIRGHFLSGWAADSIKRLVKHFCNKKTGISGDMFYTVLITNLEASFDSNHPHFQFYKNNVDKIPLS